MSKLFSPLTLRSTTFTNRLWVSPMCQYSAVDGLPNDWHMVHLGSRAVGGAGLVMTEATAVTADGRISPSDTGIWNDEQAEAWKRIAGFIRWHGSLPGLQLAHAGRKASTKAPWKGSGSVPQEAGGWDTVAPSAIAFGEYATPREATDEDLAEIKRAFVDSAQRALTAGFEVVEVHAAHGYLLNQFLSPLSNQRTDQYGGDYAGRTRYPLEVIEAVRAVWPENLPLFVRISATDWVEGGWTIDDSVKFSRTLATLGVDLVDASTGGSDPAAKIPTGPGYQVEFAEAIKTKTGIATSTVGMIDDAHQAEEILTNESADAIFMARQFLRDPYAPLHAAKELGDGYDWPVQYQRAK